MKFSELMHEARKSQRVTLRTLSEKTGIKFSVLAEIDAGRAEPWRHDKDLICSALGVYFQDHSFCQSKKEKSRGYQKHEFCKAVGCMGKSEKNKCNVDPKRCIHTAKEFHHWLKKNGFKILKVIKAK